MEIAVKYLKGCYYKVPYYVRESSYPDGVEIRIENDPYGLLNVSKYYRRLKLGITKTALSSPINDDERVMLSVQ